MKKSFAVRQLALNAVLAAVCIVLAGLSLKIGGNLKISFESLPVHLGALLFGPVDGMLIGGIGTFIYQVLLSGYGISATTVLWILPYVSCGLMDGLCAARMGRGRGGVFFTLLLSELCITLLNTFALYVDSKIYAYYSPAFVFGTLALRLFLCLVRALVYTALMPPLLGSLKKVLR